MAKGESVMEHATPVLSPVWLVRAGSHGEDEDVALDSGLAIIGFHDIPSICSIRSVLS